MEIKFVVSLSQRQLSEEKSLIVAVLGRPVEEITFIK